ncbi:hypothetical protein BAE44_0015507 [Dichanthelium oligosanthes]|uniref:Uncharacterized protein n=1 Tax=Dichanthelium oligosanthes TaxID=888268 RepID=A0A1E5VEN4_9POAL|nr:hypothetical protein BAE44_0015507 [Dichanthelium oligosanthes]
MPPPAPSRPSPGAHGGAVTPPSKPQSPLRITHDGEFYARLLTKESSLGSPSFRYYGAGPGAVPFVWESQPGTPKDAYSSSSRMLAGAAAPVITPPPSYHLRGAPFGHSARRHHHGKAGGGGGRSGRYRGYKLRWIKVGFIATVFRRLTFSKSSRSSSSAASVKSSSSTRWLFSGSNATTEARDLEYCGYEHAPPPTKGVHLCLGVRPSPWLVQFCRGDRKEPGWVYGWRP